MSAPLDAVVSADVVVVGGGVAGLTALLGLAPRRLHLLTKDRLGEGGSSPWAQGGIAAAVGGDDSPERHAADTLAVSGGLADAEIVDLLTREAPAAVRRLVSLGARLDREADASFALNREAAHSRGRILHARDATGAEVVRALVAAARRAPGLALFERAFACALHVEQGRVAGVVARHADGRRVLHLAPAVVLATGGIGRVYSHTTNPKEATGDGLAMAARAGARLADLEFVQFHPTALAVGADPMPLLTEALRGKGAVLVDETGRRFLTEHHEAAELAPRDVVARAIAERLAAGHRVYLDARAVEGGNLPRLFPTVFEACRRHGLDPRREPVPVAPAAHYHMGGIAVDARGRASLPGLWACGEAACTGAHGANRLASNSLLEALVFGARVAEDARQRDASTAALWLPATDDAPAIEVGDRPSGRSRAAAALSAEGEARATAFVRRLLWEEVGLLRSEAGLSKAITRLDRLAAELPPGDSELHNLVVVGRLVATAALARTESRGSHFRTDYPRLDRAWDRRLWWTGAPPREALVPAEPAYGRAS